MGKEKSWGEAGLSAHLQPPVASQAQAHSPSFLLRTETQKGEQVSSCGGEAIHVLPYLLPPCGIRSTGAPSRSPSLPSPSSSRRPSSFVPGSPLNLSAFSAFSEFFPGALLAGTLTPRRRRLGPPLAMA